MDGLMKGKHAQKNFGADTTISQNPGGGEGGGGGLGGVTYKDRARLPPPRPGVDRLCRSEEEMRIVRPTNASAAVR